MSQLSLLPFGKLSEVFTVSQLQRPLVLVLVWCNSCTLQCRPQTVVPATSGSQVGRLCVDQLISSSSSSFPKSFNLSIIIGVDFIFVCFVYSWVKRCCYIFCFAFWLTIFNIFSYTKVLGPILYHVMIFYSAG